MVSSSLAGAPLTKEWKSQVALRNAAAGDSGSSGGSWFEAARGSAQMAEYRAHQTQRLVGVSQRQLPEQPGAVLPEHLAQPVFDHFVEDQIRLLGLHHGSPRIDVRFHRIGLEQALTEAVDRRAGHLVERLARRAEASTPIFRQALGKGGAQLGRNRSVSPSPRRTPEPAGGARWRELGERHGGNRPGRHPVSQHRGDASRHDRGLSDPAPDSTRKERS